MGEILGDAVDSHEKHGQKVNNDEIPQMTARSHAVNEAEIKKISFQELRKERKQTHRAELAEQDGNKNAQDEYPHGFIQITPLGLETGENDAPGGGPPFAPDIAGGKHGLFDDKEQNDESRQRLDQRDRNGQEKNQKAVKENNDAVESPFYALTLLINHLE